MLHARVFDSIREIEPGRWDGCDPDPFSSHAMLTVIERSRLEGVRMRYVLLESNGDVQAAFPVSTIDVDAERLTHGWFRHGIRAARAVAPGFLFTRLCLCGTPLSIGNRPVRLAAHADATRVLRTAAGLLEELADESQASWRVFKELDARSLESFLAADLRDWLVVPSEPAMDVEVNWDCYDGFIGALRSPYRRKIRRSGEKLAQSNIRIVIEPLATAYRPSLHPLYDAVLERASVRLEHLNAAFFIEMGRAFGSRAVLIRFLREGHDVGWVCALRSGSVLHDLFHGIDYEWNGPADLYFNQLAAVLRHGSDLGVRRISLGQSTERAKSRFGAVPAPRWIALRNRSGTIDRALKAGRRILFPEQEVPALRVFSAESSNRGGRHAYRRPA